MNWQIFYTFYSTKMARNRGQNAQNGKAGRRPAQRRRQRYEDDLPYKGPKIQWNPVVSNAYNPQMGKIFC